MAATGCTFRLRKPSFRLVDRGWLARCCWSVVKRCTAVWFRKMTCWALRFRLAPWFELTSENHRALGFWPVLGSFVAPPRISHNQGFGAKTCERSRRWLSFDGSSCGQTCRFEPLCCRSTRISKTSAGLRFALSTIISFCVFCLKLIVQ